ncbi:MAG: hypothetical protein ACE5OY_09150 [Candidatus Bathyarchaeia archaeon]
MRVKAAIDPLTIFLAMIFIASALPSTISGFRFSTTHSQVPVKMRPESGITEGYVLSKHPDYRTDDRNYTRSDTLYVWVWSSRLNPEDVRDHYCQLTLDEYPQRPTFFLNYDQNMTPQYSYTGSFNLSRLEKTGDWEVQIFLKSNPPKPIIFDEEVVIHVSEIAPPPKYTLTTTTTIGGMTDPMPGSYSYTAGAVLTVRAIPDSGFVLDHWELDGVNVGAPNPISVTMDTHHTLRAVFTTSPPPAPHEVWQVVMPYVVPMGLLTLFGVTAYIIVRGRRRRIREEIKETEYRITLEVARLEAALQELDNLLEKGVISRERYEAMRREIEDELTRIRGLKR